MFSCTPKVCFLHPFCVAPILCCTLILFLHHILFLHPYFFAPIGWNSALPPTGAQHEGFSLGPPCQCLTQTLIWVRFPPSPPPPTTNKITQGQPTALCVILCVLVVANATIQTNVVGTYLLYWVVCLCLFKEILCELHIASCVEPPPPWLWFWRIL